MKEKDDEKNPIKASIPPNLFPGDHTKKDIPNIVNLARFNDGKNIEEGVQPLTRKFNTDNSKAEIADLNVKLKKLEKRIKELEDKIL